MPIAHNWYNANEARSYPLDTAATGDSDTGVQMPPDILVDCHLRFPDTVGRYAYISSVHASSSLVSITFLASDVSAIESGCDSESQSAQTSFVPLAAVNITAAEFEPGKQVLVSAFYPGVGGWIVLGHNAFKKNYSARFSSVQQSMLLPRVARAYNELPISSVAKLHHSTPLTGLVLLKAGNDIEIVKDQRLINGEWRDALIVRLSDVVNQQVLAKYTGACGGRPESVTCVKPVITSINSVKPDCNGNINLTFTTTCIYPGYDQDGMVIDYCMGLAEACLKETHLPVDGELPHQYTDDCYDYFVTSDSEPSEDLDSSEPIPPMSSISSESCSPLPHLEEFDSSEAGGFVVRSGSFARTNGAFISSHVAARNIAEWLDCSYTNVQDKNVVVELSLARDGYRANGGVVIGYARYASLLQVGAAGGHVFLLAELDKPSDSFRLMYWTGAHMVELAKAAPVGIIYDYEYRIVVEVRDLGGGNSSVTAKLYIPPALIATITANTRILQNTLENSFGLHANQAITSFNSFYVEEA